MASFKNVIKELLNKNFQLYTASVHFATPCFQMATRSTLRKAHRCSVSSISSSLRICPQGIWHPAVAGHRQRSGLQAAAGRPEGEPARLPGPGGQRAALQGREEAVLQQQQAAGRLHVHPRRRTGVSVGQLRGAGAGRPRQAAVTATCGQLRAPEEGETPPLKLS